MILPGCHGSSRPVSAQPPDQRHGSEDPWHPKPASPNPLILFGAGLPTTALNMLESLLRGLTRRGKRTVVGFGTRGDVPRPGRAAPSGLDGEGKRRLDVTPESPGRCPGLDQAAPSGLRRGVPAASVDRERSRPSIRGLDGPALKGRPCVARGNAPSDDGRSFFLLVFEPCRGGLPRLPSPRREMFKAVVSRPRRNHRPKVSDLAQRARSGDLHPTARGAK